MTSRGFFVPDIHKRTSGFLRHMNISEAMEIIDCLPRGRTRFYYFKDRYALLLLSLAARHAALTKSELRRSRFAQLLDKPLVKSALGGCGKDRLSSTVFEAHWPDSYECYLLTLDVWGSRYPRWDQTTRRGHNLVLQLNFSSEHDDQYRKLIGPENYHPFETTSHPIARGNLRTLAWSRMDIDLASGEALIEEIQTDWIRYARLARQRAERARNTVNCFGLRIARDSLIRYFDSTLSAHARHWDEAMLSATVWFLREELGIRCIYYHTHESGAALKRIRFRLPPQSLYTRLPRKFCFAPTERRPVFLPSRAKHASKRRILEQARFQVMDW